MNSGIVYLVGGGPGDPGLLTVRGRELLRRADVIVYDALVSTRLLEDVRPDAELIYAGKRAADHAMPQAEINSLLVEKGRKGLLVVRLKGGDPYLFGRGGEEALALADAGVAFEVVPGVTAGIAAAACAGIPVTHRGLASAVGFITGHKSDESGGAELDWPALARWPGTLVFYMGLANLGRICRRLTAEGLDGQTPAAVIERGTTARQRSVVSTLDDLPRAVEQAAMKAPALIVVGKVAELREHLAWFERRPLFGRTIVVTRARAQASELSARLEELGAEVIEAPVIRIVPPDDGGRALNGAATEADRYDWIIFTSVNAVDAFMDALAGQERDGRHLASCRLCAVGPATADRLRARGLLADVIPEFYRGDCVPDAIENCGGVGGKSFLLPRSEIAPPRLPQSLTQRGGRVTEVAAYRTVAELPDVAELSQRLQRREINWLTFSSSSTVRNLVALVPAGAIIQSGAMIAAIGPSTAATLRECGLEPTVEARSHTIEGLVEAILGHGRAGEGEAG